MNSMDVVVLLMMAAFLLGCGGGIIQLYRRVIRKQEARQAEVLGIARAGAEQSERSVQLLELILEELRRNK